MCICLCVSKFPFGTLAPETLATGTLAKRTLAFGTQASETLATGTQSSYLSRISPIIFEGKKLSYGEISAIHV